MSSANEELQPQPKPPRASPLDFRNTDLVSRLLAATPPYLYNMPIVPNSYFFSEMLRSFVQAKTDQQNVSSRLPGAAVHHHHHHQRRPRKRSWTQARAEYYQRDTPKSPPKPEPVVNLIEPFSASPYDTKRLIERPLELTMGKIGLNNNNNNSSSSSSSSAKISESVSMAAPSNNPHYACSLDGGSSNKQELPSIPQPPLLFPAVPPQNLNQDASTHPNLMLPPPPPIWYPPLYPPPYGFDPLHFFIDLRVSGHIYDRKNEKDDDNNGGDPPHTATQPEEAHHNKFQSSDVFKQSRHMSAFSVPIPGNTIKNIPMNLSSNSKGKEERKFDVKSMGFETTRNVTGSNYIMSNIGRIYKELGACKMEQVGECEKEKNGGGVEKREGEETTEEEKEKKRVKDLRALIGLELVVDYMNQAKPPGGGRRISSDNRDSEESSTDVEESSADSPSVEVVACGNEEL